MRVLWLLPLASVLTTSVLPLTLRTEKVLEHILIQFLRQSALHPARIHVHPYFVSVIQLGRYQVIAWRDYIALAVTGGRLSKQLRLAPWTY